MLTRDGARLQVLLDVNRRNVGRDGPNKLVIADEYTIERPWGWVFFYTTRGWLAGDYEYAVGGNAPYFVNRKDGSWQHFSTAYGIEKCIEMYEDALDQKTYRYELVIDQPGDCSFNVLVGLRQVLSISIAELNELRKRLPGVCRSGPRRELAPVLERLLAVGIRAEVRQILLPQGPQ